MESVIRRRISSRVISAIAIGFVVTLWLVSPVIGYAGLGTLISEKMVGRVGLADSSLVISRTGNGPILVGLAPTTTTVGVNVAPVGFTATLRGTVDNMNGFPTSSAYFEWGYTPACVFTTAPVTTMNAVGNFNAGVTYDPTQTTVYYRSAVDADGTNFGAVRSFRPATGQTAGVRILWYLIPIIIATGIILMILKTGVNIKMAALFVGLLVCYLIAWALIDYLF